MPRIIEFFDGSDSSTTPVIGNISASDLVKYANDAAYEAAEAGSPVGGNIYYNTTTDQVRYYDASIPGWVNVLSDNVIDSTFTISDDGDNTKKMQFEVSAVSTGVTRVYTVPDVDTTLVGTDASQTLTNKTIDADNNSITNLAHGAEVDDPSSGVHGVTGSVVGTTDTQNLSGKTFTDVTNFTDTTNATSKDTGAIVVEGGIGVEKDVYIGGNLTVDGTSTTIDTSTLDVEDANITVNSGGTEASADAGHAGLTVEMSDATDSDIGFDSTLASKFHCGEIGSEEEIVTTGHAQQITNKDIDLGTATNDVGINVSEQTRTNLEALTRDAGRVYYSTDEEKLLYDTGTELKEAGSGSGSGGINHVPVDDAQFETTSVKTWATYSDGGSDPTDGDAGTAFSTIAINSTTPLRDEKDLKWAKDANNRQGEGISIDLTFDEADQANVMEFSFDYRTTTNFDYDGTGGRSDVVCWIYDITNAVLIRPSEVELDGSGRYRSFFQAAPDSTSYRAILHINGTNALAWDMFIDNVRVGPAAQIYGTPATDWNTFDMTVDAVTTNPTKGTIVIDEARWRRVGDSMEIHYNYKQSTAGTAGSGFYLFKLPSGYEIDTDKLTTDTSENGLSNVGSASAWSSPNRGTGHIQAYDSTSLAFMLTQATIVQLVDNTYFALNNTTQQYSFRATVPIKGWSSNGAALADDGRRVNSRHNRSTSQSIPTTSTTIIDFDNQDFDTHNAVTTGAAWSWTAPKTGKAEVNAVVTYEATATTYSSLVYIYKNGSEYSASIYRKGTAANLDHSMPISDLVDVVAGDTIDIRVFQNTGGNLGLDVSNNTTFVSINMLDGNAGVIPFAEPVVYLKDVKPSTGTNGGTFTSGAWQTRDLNIIEGDSWIVSVPTGFTDKQYDNNGAAPDTTKQRFTLGPGKYDIEVSAPAYRCDNHQVKLRNITDSSNQILGQGAFCNVGDNVQNTARVDGSLILTESKTFEIQHRCQTTNAGNGFGVGNSFGVDVTHTIVKIKKRRV